MFKPIRADLTASTKLRKATYKMSSTHYHDYHELYYIVKGHSMLEIDGDLYELESGSIIIIPKGCCHRTTYISPKENIRKDVYMSEYFFSWFEYMLGKNAVNELLSKKITKIPEKRIEFVNSIMDKIAYENTNLDEISLPLNYAYMYQLILFILRCQRYDNNVIQKMDTKNRLIQDILNYIMKEYMNDISIKQIAHDFNISESALSKKFKAFTGYRLKEYIIYVRMEAAKHLLINSDKSITEIALECGFSDGNSFGDSFYRLNGISPSKYRKTYI